jgi:hypothetical protein
VGRAARQDAQGAGNTTKSQFYNEVLGESFDEATKLVSMTDLKNAATLPWAEQTEDYSDIYKESLTNTSTASSGRLGWWW